MIATRRRRIPGWVIQRCGVVLLLAAGGLLNLVAALGDDGGQLHWFLVVLCLFGVVLMASLRAPQPPVRLDGDRFVRAIRMSPPSWLSRRWYRRTRQGGVGLDSTSPGEQWARMVPYRWRRFHHWYATRRGLFWLPCPKCGHEFGGHEACSPGIPDPGDSRMSSSVCSKCSPEVNG